MLNEISRGGKCPFRMRILMKKRLLLFPGQGNVFVGMGKDLCQKYSVARDTFDEACDVLQMDLKKLCFSGELSDLIPTEIAQPAILASSIAAFRVLSERMDLHPHYFAGHSLGEFSALTAAGVLKYSDALKLVRRRGELMRDAAQNQNGVMSAIGKVPLYMIQEVCSKITKENHTVVVSNYNSPKQNVISGNMDAVSEAENELIRFGAFVKRLDVSAPFHSPLMQPAVDEFKTFLEKIVFEDPRRVLSNVTAKEHSADMLVENLAKQLVSPVRWAETMEYAETLGIRLAIDMGPKDVMKKLVIQNYRSVKALAVDNSDDLVELEKIIQYDAPIPFVSRCTGIAVATKNLCTDENLYEEDVVRPYEELRQLSLAVEREDRNATMDEMKHAIDLLIRILSAKKVQQEEKEQCLQRLYLDTETEMLFAE